MFDSLRNDPRFQKLVALEAPKSTERWHDAEISNLVAELKPQIILQGRSHALS
jgi:hypothetical protein